MKRHASDSSDQYKSSAPRRSWDHNSPNRSENSNNNQSSYSTTEQQPSSEPTASDPQSVPTTTSQSFPAYAYNSEYYNNHMDPLQMMMQNQMMMRNYPWSENQMYPMPMMDNMSVNPSNIPYRRNMEPVNNGSTNSNYESQTQQTESNNTEVVRPPSPPPAVPYSDKEATTLIEKLRNEETYRSALQTLTAWLMKSEFNKDNSSYLFALVQTAQNNIWRLMNEKASFKEDLNKEKLEVSRKINEIVAKFKEIWKVYEVARLQKVWDQFTKGQRKVIGSWMEDTKQIMSTLTKEIAAGDMDPDDDSSEKSPDSADLHQTEEYQKLQEEMDSLRTQVRAIQDENASMQNEGAMELTAFLNKMNDLKEQDRSIIDEIKCLEATITKGKENASKRVSSKNHQPILSSNSSEGKVHNSANEEFSTEDVRLVILIASFLNVHPFGASVEYIWSYLKNIDPSVDCKYVENLLCRFPGAFKEESRGIGCHLTKEWVFLGIEHLLEKR